MRAFPRCARLYEDAFKVGAAVNTDQLEEGSDFYQLITKHYNTFVTENEMKPMYLNPSEGTFYFDAADKFVEFGRGCWSHAARPYADLALAGAGVVVCG